MSCIDIPILLRNERENEKENVRGSEFGSKENVADVVSKSVSLSSLSYSCIVCYDETSFSDNYILSFQASMFLAARKNFRLS